MARASETNVVDSAKGTIVTSASINRSGIRANSSSWVANACIVTLITRGTSYRIRTHAFARLTTIALRTRVTVATRSAVGTHRIRTLSGRRIAPARRVTLIARRARNASAQIGADAILARAARA